MSVTNLFNRLLQLTHAKSPRLAMRAVRVGGACMAVIWANAFSERQRALDVAAQRVVEQAKVVVEKRCGQNACKEHSDAPGLPVNAGKASEIGDRVIAFNGNLKHAAYGMAEKNRPLRAKHPLMVQAHFDMADVS